MDHLNNIVKNFIPKSPYCKILFDLYVSYIKRYKYNYWIITQLKNISIDLQERDIPVLVSWERVEAESIQFEKKYNSYRKRIGCPYKKIGLMLLEINVLPPYEYDYNIKINKKIKNTKIK